MDEEASPHGCPWSRQAAKCQDEGELRQMIREPDSDALANQDQDNKKRPDFLPPAGRLMFLQRRSSYSTTPVWRPGAKVRPRRSCSQPRQIQTFPQKFSNSMQSECLQSLL